MRTYGALISTPDGVKIYTVDAENWESADEKFTTYCMGSDFTGVLWVEELEQLMNSLQVHQPLPKV